MSSSGSPKRCMGLSMTCFWYSSGNFSAHALAAGDSAPGQDHVDADAVLAPLLGGDLGQAAQGLLVGAVGELTRDAEHAGGGGEVDDAALVLLLHVGEGGLHVVERADGAGLPGGEHVLVGGVLDRGGGHDGLAVVDDDVDGAEGVHRGLDDLLDAARSAESQVMASPWPPSSSISATVCWMGASRRPCRRPSRRAWQGRGRCPLPMPWPAPVTMATFSLSCFMWCSSRGMRLRRITAILPTGTRVAVSPSPSGGF